jgi:hypothetical protein
LTNTYPAVAWGGVPVAQIYGGTPLSPSDRHVVVSGGDFEGEVWVDETHCQFIREDGTQCRSWPNKKHDSVYCVGHTRTMAVLNGIDKGLTEAGVDAASTDSE